jgi:hypothetical protein
MDSGEKENVRKSLEFVIVGAPEEEGGVPDTDDPSSPSSSASPKSPRAPPTKRARLYRVFEYDEAHIESERAAAERVLSKMKKRKKNARPNRKSAGKPAETSDTESELHESLEEIDYEEEEYVIRPLYHARDLRDEEEMEDGEEEEVAVFCQAEHQHTGLVNQSALQRRSDADGSRWKIARREGATDEQSYRAQRIDWMGAEDGHEGTQHTMADLELDYTAHPGYSVEYRLIEEGSVNPEKEVRHAFHQVPGRPNVYAFGGFGGVGFEGCGLKDSWSDPKLIRRRDVHVQTWEDGSYDYVIQLPPCTPAQRKSQLKFSRAKPSHSLRDVSTSREDAKRKLDCLTLQMREYCVERAFEERSIDKGRVVLWQGDPKPRVVFLFKAVTKRVVGTAPYVFPTKSSKNGLGVLQAELTLALEEAIRECYSHAHGETIHWKRMQELIKAMVPICCKDTGPSDSKIDTRKAGVAMLYAVPFYDPTGWGKHKIDEHGNTEYGAGYASGSGGGKAQDWQSGTSSSEFPDNVLELTSFYVQKALDIMAPMVVISLNKFLTRYLNSGLDSKMLQWARDVRPNKWFRVKLLSARGHIVTPSSSSAKGKGKGKARVIQMFDPVTGVVVDEQRAETFGVRTLHPYYVGQNMQERMPTVKQTMAMVAKRLFQEMEMNKLISGKGHDVARFYMNPAKAMRDGTMEGDRQARNAKFEGVADLEMARWVGGNLVCRDATMDQIRKMTDSVASTSFISVFVLSDCDPGETFQSDFDFSTLLGTQEGGGNYALYHTPLREDASSCLGACVFPPNVPVGKLLDKVHLWPTQWMYEYVSRDSGRTGKLNHFLPPRFAKPVTCMEKHEEAKAEVLEKIKAILDRTVPNHEDGGRVYDPKARLSIKGKYLELKDEGPSGLFTKRVMITWMGNVWVLLEQEKQGEKHEKGSSGSNEATGT